MKTLFRTPSSVLAFGGAGPIYNYAPLLNPPVGQTPRTLAWDSRSQYDDGYFPPPGFGQSFAYNVRGPIYLNAAISGMPGAWNVDPLSSPLLLCRDLGGFQSNAFFPPVAFIPYTSPPYSTTLSPVCSTQWYWAYYGPLALNRPQLDYPFPDFSSQYGSIPDHYYVPQFGLNALTRFPTLEQTLLQFNVLIGLVDSIDGTTMVGVQWTAVIDSRTLLWDVFSGSGVTLSYYDGPENPPDNLSITGDWSGSSVTITQAL